MGRKQKSVQCPKCYTINSGDRLYCKKCGSTLEIYEETLSYPSSRELPPDDTIHFKPGKIFDNRYRIIEEIGRGGMGRVYKAEDTELNITVALKIIRPKYSLNRYFIEQFKKETLTARSISHENVIRIYDLGEANKIKYISMEYIKGQDLRDLIQASGSLTIETAINMTTQMCEALKAAHQKGIVHQDLKPSNIMVDNDGQVYIMDFGLAKALYSQEAIKTGRIAGTPQYMSPEQARGEKVDQRSDIYSLGIIMYEMLTGTPLFEAESIENYIQKHTHEIPQPPSNINPHIPKYIEAIILKCLEKDKEKRYQNIKEILTDLLEQRLETKPRSVTDWVKKYRYMALVIGLVFIIAISIFLLRKEPVLPLLKRKRISVAIMYMINNTGDRSLDYLSRTFTELLIADLLQSKYIRVLTGDRLYDILQDLELLEATSYSSEDLMRVASLGGVDHILQGNYTMAGETLRINAFLHEASSMEPVGSERVTGVGIESIFAMADELTRKIKVNFNFTPEEIDMDIDKDVEIITTDSQEALKYYIEGKRLYKERKFKESNEVLEKAVALDPGFALAYKQISDNYGYMVKPEQAQEYIQKALSLIDRVSEREYYLLKGDTTDSYQSKIENYQKLLEIYPDDLKGLSHLGSLYRNMEEWDLAQEQFEKIIEIDNKQELALENIAYIYMAKGLYEKARKLLESNQHIFSNKIFFHIRMGIAFLCQNKYDLALSEVNKAKSLDPDDIFIKELIGHIYQIRGDYDSAVKIYRQLLNSDDHLSQYLGWLWLSYLYLMRGEYTLVKKEILQGIEHSQKFDFIPSLYNSTILSAYVDLQLKRFPEALTASNQALKLANEIDYITYKNFALHLRGLVLVKMKKLEEARKTAEELKRQIERTGRKKYLRHYHHLMGMIAREEGMISRAIDDFSVAYSLLPKQHEKYDEHILYLDFLASAYFENGELDRARKEYENIISLTTGRLRWGDLYSKSFYWLGRIFQIQKQKDKAIEHYKKFLKIWENADPDLPELGDARKQLEVMGGRVQE